MKKKILIIAGGFSKEREISLKTAKGVFNAIKKKYITKICEPNGELIKNLRAFKPNVVFNALHGRDGEDGVAQSYFECLRVPYTHSGVISSCNAMNKVISKKIFQPALTPKYFKDVDYSNRDPDKIHDNIRVSVFFTFPTSYFSGIKITTVGDLFCNKETSAEFGA